MLQKVLAIIILSKYLVAQGYDLNVGDDKSYHESELIIRNLNYENDYAAMERLFAQADNWYWLVMNSDTFEKTKFLRLYESLYFANVKVAIMQDQLIGFCSYKNHIFCKEGSPCLISDKYWILEGLLVDQDYRHKGIAHKLLRSAAGHMISCGAIEIHISTGSNNLRAQNLYKSLGAQFVGNNLRTNDCLRAGCNDQVYFIWYM